MRTLWVRVPADQIEAVVFLTGGSRIGIHLIGRSHLVLFLETRIAFAVDIIEHFDTDLRCLCCRNWQRLQSLRTVALIRIDDHLVPIEPRRVIEVEREHRLCREIATRMGVFRDKRIVLGELSCQLGTARLRDGEYLNTLDGSLAAGCIIRTAQLRIILRTAVGMETLRPALPIDEGAIGDIVFLGDISLKPDLDAGNAVANATLAKFLAVAADIRPREIA